MRTRQMFPNILRSLELSAALIGALASSAFAQTLNVTDDTYTDDQNPFSPMGADPAIRRRPQPGRIRALRPFALARGRHCHASLPPHLCEPSGESFGPLRHDQYLRAERRVDRGHAYHHQYPANVSDPHVHVLGRPE